MLAQEDRIARAESRPRVVLIPLYWLASVIFLHFAESGPALAAEPTERPRIVGFLPVVSTERLVRRFEPLVDFLADEIGVPVVLETAPNYAEFVRRTHEDQRYDYLFTAPHFYFVAQRKAGYRVVARVDGELLRSVIVVRRDSDISQPRDLCGKTIATPDPLALVTVMVRRRLIQAGCDPDRESTLSATPSHNAALYAAYRGATQAAGLGTIPFARAEATVREGMRVVAETEGTPNMPFSVAPWISDEEATRLADALVGLSTNGERPGLLQHLGWRGFAKAVPEDYDLFADYAEILLE
ncbi:MAG: phosphate/phosphite/phosphonate ABC transporter substrate-binding protein [Inquilinus sp.]|nr:phosphate/phosphite/phosphonate ABC transporter substrate-binding protein [Inquilinus sp.]